MAKHVLSAFARLNERVKQYEKTYQDACEAIYEMKEAFVWKDEGYASFNAYVRTELHIAEAKAWRMAGLGRACVAIRTHLGKDFPMPQTEGQARPLTRISGEEIARAWKHAVGKDLDTMPTEYAVRAAVVAVTSKELKREGTRPLQVYVPVSVFDAVFEIARVKDVPVSTWLAGAVHAAVMEERERQDEVKKKPAKRKARVKV